MLGGSVDPDLGGLSDDELSALARRDVTEMLGLEREPVFEERVRWPRAIPQYDLQHSSRIEAVSAELATDPGLFLAGNSLEGVSFARSGVTGRRRGIEAAEWLATAPGA
jgi:oxygen-dependent protoporphyrinogen oxidase